MAKASKTKTPAKKPMPAFMAAKMKKGAPSKGGSKKGGGKC